MAPPALTPAGNIARLRCLPLHLSRVVLEAARATKSGHADPCRIRSAGSHRAEDHMACVGRFALGERVRRQERQRCRKRKLSADGALLSGMAKRRKRDDERKRTGRTQQRTGRTQQRTGRTEQRSGRTHCILEERNSVLEERNSVLEERNSVLEERNILEERNSVLTRGHGKELLLVAQALQTSMVEEKIPGQRKTILSIASKPTMDFVEPQ